MSRSLRALVLCLVAFGMGIAPAMAAPLDSRIGELKKQLAELEKEYLEQLKYRAEYKTKLASLEYLNAVLRYDRKKLVKVRREFNRPVRLMRAFVSSVATSLGDALKKRRYTSVKDRRYLWITTRFGLSAVRRRPLSTIRVDLTDRRGAILHSFGPYQRRVLGVLESFAIPIHKDGLGPGSYRLKVMVEVGGTRSERRVYFRIKPQKATN